MLRRSDIFAQFAQLLKQFLPKYEGKIFQSIISSSLITEDGSISTAYLKNYESPTTKNKNDMDEISQAVVKPYAISIICKQATVVP
ncbi:hypothetical protein T4A_2936 [Trichinella pseudospiralis]|uniref:Uncharacterized protein n=1 Tax=Trichinella pseudospiralis TaxID=6337 RepID=A0A0V1EM77_TRIPS|nr:hypothetical protein T4A_2936 [Trichinella pseudospiralis]